MPLKGPCTLRADGRACKFHSLCAARAQRLLIMEAYVLEETECQPAGSGNMQGHPQASQFNPKTLTGSRALPPPGTVLEWDRKISKKEPLPLRRSPGRRLANKQPVQNVGSVPTGVCGREENRKTDGQQMTGGIVNHAGERGGRACETKRQESGGGGRVLARSTSEQRCEDGNAGLW